MSSIKFGKHCWQNINYYPNEYIFFFFKTIDRFSSRFLCIGCYLADTATCNALVALYQ